MSVVLCCHFGRRCEDTGAFPCWPVEILRHLLEESGVDDETVPLWDVHTSLAKEVPYVPMRDHVYFLKVPGRERSTVIIEVISQIGFISAAVFVSLQAVKSVAVDLLINRDI